MRRVCVTIDRLALAGFEPAERAALVEGLRSELSQMLANSASRGMVRSSRSTPVVRLGRVPVIPGASGSRNFGAGLARAIGRSLGL